MVAICIGLAINKEVQYIKNSVLPMSWCMVNKYMNADSSEEQMG